MQRKYEEYHYKVSKKWPLFFWYQCQKCKKEYRREKIWQVENENPKWGFTIICSHCASNPRQAFDITTQIFDEIKRNRKPPIGQGKV